LLARGGHRMQRALIVLALLLASAPALAQDESPPEPPPVQLAPAPAYGSVRSEPMNVRVVPFIGFMLAGAKPFGTFSNGVNFGPDFTFRGGAEILIGPGVSIAPEGTLRFTRFGTDSQLVSSVIIAGFMLGGRFGFEVANLVTPYFAVHFGYAHGQATG